MKRVLVVLFAVIGMALLEGCVSKDMVRSSAAAPQSVPGKAMVVFMHPFRMGGAIQSSVYDTTNGNNVFIGIVSSGTKVAYQADPGTHLFMVVGENADFMNASLDAGKTYYVLVSPRMGMWKARFSLLPIHNDASAKYNLKSPEFSQWQRETNFVEKSGSANAWYSAHAADVATKQADYMQRWNTASAEQKAELTLRPEDGI